MRITQARRCSVVATFLSILLVLTLVAGCTPKAIPAEAPQIGMMVETNFTSSEYDAGPLLLWNIGQNSLQTSGTSVVHVSDFNNGGASAVLATWFTSSGRSTMGHPEQETAHHNDIQGSRSPDSCSGNAVFIQRRWLYQAVVCFKRECFCERSSRIGCSAIEDAGWQNSHHK